MNGLTDKEIEDFFRVVDRIIPIVSEMLTLSREAVFQLRHIEMTEENLQILENYTEKSCWLYNLERFCLSLTKEEINNKRNIQSVYEQVRNIINIGKNHA